jgi:hypothetical protein
MKIDITQVIRNWDEPHEDPSSEFYIPFDQRTIPIKYALIAADEIDRLREAEHNFHYSKTTSDYWGCFLILLLLGAFWGGIIGMAFFVYKALS